MGSNGHIAPRDFLVGEDWEVEPLKDHGVGFVEVDVDTTAYEKGHLPGAVGWNWRTDLQAKPARDLAPKEQLEQLLSKSGIGPESAVVLYGDNNNWFAAYAYWTLKYYGLDNVKLINGGRVKLEAEGRQFTTDVASPAPASFKFGGGTNEAIRAYRHDVSDRIVKAFLGVLLQP